MQVANKTHTPARMRAGQTLASDRPVEAATCNLSDVRNEMLMVSLAVARKGTFLRQHKIKMLILILC